MENLRRLAVKACVSMIGGVFLIAQIVRADAPYERRIIDLPSARVRSSVALGDIDGDGTDDIVVSSDDGVVSVYRGNGTKVWSYDTGTAAIEGKAAIGDINGNGRDEVIVGIGSASTPNAPGGVIALSHRGDPLWRYASKDFNKDGVPDGVYASPALADITNDGNLEIIYGGFDGYIRVLRYDGSLLWEYFTRDTIWSSPAVGDITRDGKLEVVIGGDSHLEPYYSTIDGGRLYVLRGEDGTTVPGFPISVDETIWSSPTLVDLTQDGWLDIIVGTGNCWTDPECAVPKGNTHPVTKALYGWDHTGQPLPGWPIPLPAYTMASPSAADLTGDDKSEVVINTADGYVHVFQTDGTGLPGWPKRVTTPAGVDSVVHKGTTASPVIADLTGDGQPEIVIPSNWEVVVFDVNGIQLTRDSFPSPKWDLSTEYTVGKTPAVGDIDGDGKIELVIGGARSSGTRGAIYLWDFAVNADVDRIPWPYGRLNRQNLAACEPAPTLSISSPDGLTTMCAQGSEEPVTVQLSIASSTSVPISWQIEVPSGMSVSTSEGLVTSDGIVIKLTISTKSLLSRITPYSIGDVVVSGSIDGVPVANSPLRIPIHVIVVEEMHRTFAPFVTRR